MLYDNHQLRSLAIQMIEQSSKVVGIRRLRDLSIWYVPAGFVVFCMALYVTPFARYLNYIFPLGALLVGAFFYFRSRVLYLGYAWWMVMLVPLVRRLVDFRCGWTEVSPILLTPFLICALGGVSVLQYLGELKRPHLRPFMLIGLGLIYAFLIGIVKVGVFPATFAMLEWFIPVLFAAHIVIHWRDFEQMDMVVRRVFTLGLLVMGVYGVLQYVILFPWDSYWMTSSKMVTQGVPYPFYVRVFSTMNSSLPLACVLLGALILKPEGSRKFLYACAVVPAFMTFLLSLVRCTWGAWFIAVAYIVVASRKTKIAQTLFWMSAAFLLVVVIMFLVPPIYDAVMKRALTFERIGDDVSYLARLDFHKEYAGTAFGSVVGGGLGSVGSATRLSSAGGFLGELAHFDSGVLMLPYVLGWPGLFLYLGGLAILVADIFLLGNPDQRARLVPYQALIIGFFAMMLFGNVIISQCGIMFWTIIGLARAYLCHSRKQMADDWGAP